MSRKLTSREFVEAALGVHDNRYDYSKSVYVNNHTKVEIGCKEHGSFWQIPNSHLSNKRGCPECGGTKRLTIKTFISKANRIHGGLYDYSKSQYRDARSDIVICCPIHGNFTQLVYAHLNGKGCPKCGGTEKLNTKIFVDKAVSIHGDKYDYSLVDYKTNRHKVKIKCYLHGEFLQTPNQHMLGQGCPACVHRVSKPETEFLNYCHIPNECRQKHMLTYNVDGYDPQTNTVYEFLGDYWHGNLRLYSADKIHPKRKMTYAKINYETFRRFDKLKKFGVRIKYVWESEWKKYTNGLVNSPVIIDY